MPKGIHQLPSGSWRVRWTEPDGRRGCRTFDTEEEALDFQRLAKGCTLVRRVRETRDAQGELHRLACEALGPWPLLLHAAR